MKDNAVRSLDEPDLAQAEAYLERAKRTKRSREDVRQGRLIPEDPEIDIGV